MSKGHMQSSGWDRIHWVTPVDEREFRGAFGVMRRKLTLEVFRASERKSARAGGLGFEPPRDVGGGAGSAGLIRQCIPFQI